MPGSPPASEQASDEDEAAEPSESLSAGSRGVGFRVSGRLTSRRLG